MIRQLLVTLGTGLLLGSTAWAQTAIDSIPGNDTVTITGEVTGVWGNNFVLQDDSADILVEAGPTWYHDIGIETGEVLQVTGKLSRDQFGAFTIERENGQVIRVRPEDGTPPWAGRRDTGSPPARAEERAPRQAEPRDIPEPVRHTMGMSRDDVERVLRIALDYGFVAFDEVEYEGDGIIEVEGWLADGWEAEIEVEIASGEIVKEKRERASGGRGLTIEQILRAMDVAAAEGMVSFDEIELDGDEIEVEGWDAAGREMEIDLDERDFRILNIDID